MDCCPRVSVWWWTKITIALALFLQAGVVLGGGVGASLVPIPLWVAQVVIGVGALLSLGHYGILKSTTRDIARPARLVTRRGLYPWIRHPMYFGDFVVIVGLGLEVVDVDDHLRDLEDEVVGVHALDRTTTGQVHGHVHDGDTG